MFFWHLSVFLEIKAIILKAHTAKRSAPKTIRAISMFEGCGFEAR
jgi:hypothetical protein